MADTNKAEDLEYGLPNAHGVVRSRETPSNRSGVATNPSEKELASQPEESSSPPELLPEVAEPDLTDDFAESVMFGLEQAGFGSDPLPEENQPDPEMPEEPDELKPAANYETFFAGWGTEADIEVEPETDYHEPTKTEEPRPAHISPFELSLAASSRELEADYEASPNFDVVSKHDALADAVQSALLNIYGDGASQPQSSPSLESGFAWDLQPDAGATHEIAAEDDTAQDDGLSPQDVILNYFSYNSDTPTEELSEFEAIDDDEHFQPEPDEPLGPRFNSFSRTHQPGEGSPSPLSRPPARRESLSQAGYRYEGLPSYPVPAERPREPIATRDSGRLLGAAGIGLVGGIAIAATLSVFVINSYGPQQRSSQGGTGNIQARPNGGRTGEPAIIPLEIQRKFQDTGTPLSRSDVPPVSAQVQPSSDSQGDLTAADAAGVAGQSVPLSIAVKSQRSSEQTLVSITGIPEGARLNVGIDAGGGNWLLPPRRLNGLMISLPNYAPSMIPLSVQLLDSNVRTPLSDKKDFIVRVAATASQQGTLSQNASRDADRETPVVPNFTTQTVPDPIAKAAFAQSGSSQTQGAAFSTQTIRKDGEQATMRGVQAGAAALSSLSSTTDAQATNSVTQPEIDDLIREGNKRMKDGDILEARGLYQKAVIMGDPEAALAMGRSYDPIYFTRLEKKNAEPDPAAAFEWYRKAMDAGASQTAKLRIENLKHFLNE